MENLDALIGARTEGKTFLHFIDKPELIDLLIKHGLNIDTECDEGYTPLITQIFLENMDMVKYFVEKGADVNYVSKHSGITPLHAAAFMKNAEIFNYLNKCGAVQNKCGEKSFTMPASDFLLFCLFKKHF